MQFGFLMEQRVLWCSSKELLVSCLKVRVDVTTIERKVLQTSVSITAVIWAAVPRPWTAKYLPFSAQA